MMRLSMLCCLAVLLLTGCGEEKNSVGFPWVFIVVIVLTAAGVSFVFGLDDRAAERRRNEKRARRKEESLDQIVTSSTSTVIGRNITRHMRFVSVSADADQEMAEIDFLLEVKALGANGVINMRVQRDEGSTSIHGDAVLLE